MQFLTSFHQYIVGLLRLWIVLADDVVDLRQHRVWSAVSIEFAEISRTVGQKNSLVGCSKLDRRIPSGALDQQKGSGDHQNSGQSPNCLNRDTSLLILR